MRLAIQRVLEARVEVDGEVVGRIGRGLLALVGLGEGDAEAAFPRLADKMVGLRIFPDEGGNMNRSVEEVSGGILLVSQFTLYADVRKGRRPSFTRSMPPEQARELFEVFAQAVRARHTAGPVETGRFGAMMHVHLVNDGPVTIWLDSAELGGGG